MHCEDFYRLAEKYLSVQGQKLVEELLRDDQILIVKAVIVGGMLSTSDKPDSADIVLLDSLLNVFGLSFKELN